MIYRFEPFELDEQTFCLTRDGERIPLEPKSLRVLLLLLQSEGRLLEKDAILEAVWKDTFVEETTLTRAIALIRKQLSDDPRRPTYIETVPTLGYRFIAPVEVRARKDRTATPPEDPAPDIPPAPDPTPPAIPTPRRHPTRLYAAIVAGIALAAAAILTWRIRTPPPPTRTEWTQLTHFNDSATSPALSPDGHILTFLRGPSTFFGHADVYVKFLPNGEPARLTHDDSSKMSPAIAPDGARIVYTVHEQDRGWDTFVVPLLGGDPAELLPNAEGLTWIGPKSILFSEIKSGSHMAIVTADETRAGEREIYAPPHDRGMGHRSFLSPDRKNLLIVEMDNGGWLPCRLVPFDGSSPGRQVGPPKAACTYAAWSPDGQWMYLNSDAGGTGYHIWRQRLSGGDPDQLTFGPTEQEGIAILPDGRSLISSVGLQQDSIWLHGPGGDRQLTSEESASQPLLSHDGAKLYYLSSSSGSHLFANGQLWQIRLPDGRPQLLLPDFVISYFGLSPDDKQVVFSARDPNGHPHTWIAPLDRRTPPRQIPGLDFTEPAFGPSGDLIFLASGGKSNYLYRSNLDGSGRQKISENPVLGFMRTSPDAQWAIFWAPVADNSTLTSATLAFPTTGGPPLRICDGCAVTWTPDQKSIFFVFHSSVYRVPLPPGNTFPPLPPDGVQSEAALKALPGATLLKSSPEDFTSFDFERAVIAADPSSYIFVKAAVHRNLYQIPIP